MCLYYFNHEISKLPRPITVKLCHMNAIWVHFIMQVLKFGGSERNWGPKTCKIRFDFRQLQNSISNISGMGQYIQNRKEVFHRRFLRRSAKKVRWTLVHWLQRTRCEIGHTQIGFFGRMYRVAQNKIPHPTICNIFATNGQILKILEAL